MKLPWPYGSCACEECEARYWLDYLTERALQGNESPMMVALAVQNLLKVRARAGAC